MYLKLLKLNVITLNIREIFFYYLLEKKDKDFLFHHYASGYEAQMRRYYKILIRHFVITKINERGESQE